MTTGPTFDHSGRRIANRAELLGAGMSGAAITAAVRSGVLIRLRRDHYALPGTHRSVGEAVRIGGRLACISALADRGVHVLDSTFTHVHLDRSASRSRSPRSRFVALTRHNRDGAVLHWTPLMDGASATDDRVSVVDALVQSARCQHPWQFVASLDSALHEGEIRAVDVPRIFAALPLRFRQLESCVDARSVSGQESVLRMILIDAGIPFEAQVEIAGVGRVDFLVAGCLVVEADSRLAHDGWDAHVRDRTRDVLCAVAGFPTLRLLYSMIMFRPDLVRVAILSELAAMRGSQPRISR